MGGEKFSSMLFLTCSMGSPPRGRGKEAVAPFPLPAAGITPAWAGKRTSPHLYCELSKDHPRVGGEKSCIRLLSVCIAGSPPRGRGKVDVRLEGQRGHGITPAWAGKRASGTPSSRRSGDHPRVGGEKAVPMITSSYLWGSPPRGRGKAAIERVWKQWLGITPAWAGKSDLRDARLASPKDHPRVGGEKPLLKNFPASEKGSPPRGRGKGSLRSIPRSPRRITPAWAGKSSKPIEYLQEAGDHPRVGGEKTKKIP